MTGMRRDVALSIGSNRFLGGFGPAPAFEGEKLMSVPSCHYLRVSQVLRAVNGDFEVVAGLEFSPGEDLPSLEHELNELLKKAMILNDAGHSGIEEALWLSNLVFSAMADRWPHDRARFLEVQCDNSRGESWVQVITPDGWPPRKVQE